MFLPEIWDAYRSSIPFQRINKLIEADLKHLETYFKEVKSRVEINCKNPQNRSKMPDLLSIFDDYYSSFK